MWFERWAEDITFIVENQSPEEIFFDYKGDGSCGLDKKKVYLWME